MSRFLEKFYFSWSENDYFFSFVCPTSLTMEDIRRMIESIRPQPLKNFKKSPNPLAFPLPRCYNRPNTDKKTRARRGHGGSI